MSLPPSYGPSYPLLQALYYQQLAGLIADVRARRAQQQATPAPAPPPAPAAIEPTPLAEPPAPAPPPQQNDADGDDEDDDEYWDEFNRTLLYLTLMQQVSQPRGPFGTWGRGRFREFGGY